MTVTRKLKVFLCHASQDKPAVRKLYARLNSEPWIDPWLDEERLLPGMDWDLEIQKALREADMIIVCLSSESVAKEGYVQREFKRALSYAEEKPDGTIYIIPLRLNECTPPTKFQQWQWVDYFADGSDGKLFKSLRLRAEKLGVDFPKSVSEPSAPMSKPVIVESEPSSFTSGGRPFFTFGGMDFVKVKGGDFYMGSDDVEFASPQHLIYQLDYDFYIGRYPVTNQEYSLYVRDTGSPIVMKKDMARHPVSNVSFVDAHGFVAWLNKKQADDLPTGYVFRLPSEAEWEKAARGEEGNEFPWGNRFDPRRCNSLESGVGGTTPVGAYSPQGDSAFGAADMAGNVWEWTRSLSRGYPYTFGDERESDVVLGSSHYVLRGGSFKSDKEFVRCVVRTAQYPPYKDIDFGFRVAICPVK
ncbi:MAG: SUMF1/EgtB/PvdO family nonheme iron enzyme [Anaerolineales bacterium]|nr:SUMF1/EgtB/PvdO family nonheme iron enzyme [Anaerolineales bacterium]